MEEATLIKHNGGDLTRVDWILVRVDDILFAHEMEETGDEGLRLLAERERNEMAVTVHFNGNTSLQLSGKIRKRALELGAPRDHNFIVVLEPKLLGHAVKRTHPYAALENLSYVIVNRNRLAFVFQ